MTGTPSSLGMNRAGWLLALFLAACGGGGGSSGTVVAPTDPGPEEPRPVDPPPPAGPLARLDRVAGCDELTDALEADAAEKIAVQAEELRRYGFGVDEFIGVPVPGAPAPTDGDAEEDGARDFTDTNVQEEGVDEADIVETDGQRIYLLHGDEFVVLDAWPPAEAALESNLKIEGYPSAMFVDGARAVVFSTVLDDGRFGGEGECHFIGGPEPFVDVALVGDVEPCRPSLVKTTVLDLSAAPTVVREIYTEGYYTAARRHGDVVRAVVQGGHGLPTSIPDFYARLYAGEFPATEAEYFALVDEWEQDAIAALASLTLDDWLPRQFEVRGGQLEEVPPLCSAVYLPDVGQTQHGMTRVVGLDMTRDDVPFVDTLVVGGASTVYASLDNLVLAQPDWNADDEGDRTAVHVFGAGAGTLATDYLGSGFVPGVPHGSFSFDMDDGVLRIATTKTAVDEQHRVTTTNRIVTTTLQEGELISLGTTGDLAPDERIFAVRYIGDRGYLVTFRQIDPLFVVDLSNPATPTVLGELEMPGFSEYMHPLGPNHLLTIGQAADLEGRVTGLALRIFDVSDDSNPLLTHLYAFEEQGWSPANYDHLAFVFHAERGILTFPYVSYDGPFRSELQVFSVDSEDGFRPVGAVDHSDLTVSQCGTPEDWRCTYDPEIRRGLLLEDFVYSISEAGVRVHGVADLTDPVATVVLPEIGVLPGPPVAFLE